MKTMHYFQEVKLRLSFFICCFLYNWWILYAYKDQLLFLLRNVQNSNSPSFLATNLPEIFFVSLKLTAFIAFLVSLPIFMIQLWMFLQPALYKNEARKIRKILFLFHSLLFLNVFLTIGILLPSCWKFFFSFHLQAEIHGMEIHLETRLKDYFSFIFDLFFLVFIFCSFCFVFFTVLTQNRILFVTKHRKLFHFLFLCFATLLTPPDVVSQVIIALIFSFFLEVFLLGVFIHNQYKERANNGT